MLSQRDARFYWLEEAEFDKHWEIMKSFHQKRWNQKNKQGAFGNRDFSMFHSKFRKHHKVRMSVLELDGEPIAINYYLFDLTTLYFYQSGWDSNSSNLSPGFSLHMWSIDSCTESTYDFMMGANDKSYKKQYGCNRIEKMYRVSGYKNKLLRTVSLFGSKIKKLIFVTKGSMSK